MIAYAYLVRECGWTLEYIGWNLTMRQLSKLMDGFSLLNELEDPELAKKNKQLTPEEEDQMIDAQLDEMEMNPVRYNITRGSKK